jgi:coenzyme F420-0:L-glutamate ligase/coenzyme F420-1:gamma-L-glutamate ligase
VARAIAAVAGVVAPGTVFTQVTDERLRTQFAAAVPGWPPAATGMILCAPPVTAEPTGPAEREQRAAGPDSVTLIRFGADLHRLRAALAAEGLPSAVSAAPAGSTAAAALAL